MRKPSVYAHAIRDTSTSEPGGSGRSRPVAAASAAWNNAAAVNCIAVSEKPQLRGLSSVRPALTPAVLTALQRNQPATIVVRTRPVAGRAGMVEELAGEQLKEFVAGVDDARAVKTRCEG